MTTLTTPPLPTLIVDPGSDSWKTGLASEKYPSIRIPSVVPGELSNLDFTQNKSNPRFPLLQETLDSFGVVNPSDYSWRYPRTKGHFQDFHSLEKLLHATIDFHHKIQPEEHRVMISLPDSAPRPNKEKIVQIMFETFNVMEYACTSHCVAAMAGMGLGTGICVDSGYEMTLVSPLYEGLSLPLTISQLDMGGRTVTEQLENCFPVQRKSIGAMEWAVTMRKFKEENCFVAQDFFTELNLSKKSNPTRNVFKLPDGQSVCLGSECFECCEGLFSPALFGMDCEGLSEAVKSTILKSDVDIRQDLANNILVCGGNTLLNGFEFRIQKNVEQLFPSFNVRVFAPDDREDLVFKGCTVLNEMLEDNITLATRLVTKAEYEENGPRVIHPRPF